MAFLPSALYRDPDFFELTGRAPLESADGDGDGEGTTKEVTKPLLINVELETPEGWSFFTSEPKKVRLISTNKNLSLSPDYGKVIGDAVREIQPDTLFLGQPNYPLVPLSEDVDEIRGEVFGRYLRKYSAEFHKAIEAGEDKELMTMFCAVDAMRARSPGDAEPTLYLGDIPEHVLWHNFFLKVNPEMFVHLRKEGFKEHYKWEDECKAHIAKKLPHLTGEALEKEQNRLLDLTPLTHHNVQSHMLGWKSDPELHELEVPMCDLNLVHQHTNYVAALFESLFIDCRRRFLAFYLYNLASQEDSAKNIVCVVDDMEVAAGIANIWDKLCAHEMEVAHSEVAIMTFDNQVPYDRLLFMKKALPKYWDAYVKRTPEDVMQRPTMYARIRAATRGHAESKR